MFNKTKIVVVTCLSFLVSGCGQPHDASSTATTEPVSATNVASSVSHADDWRDMFDSDDLPLQNIPVVIKTVETDEGLAITVVNNGTTTLGYYSTGATHIQLFQEVQENGEWTQSNWEWCGYGKSDYELAPSSQVNLFVEFWSPDRQERMLGMFTEKGTKRKGMVLLAVEPGPG